ncbi:phosphoglycan beta 13 galactosyltransferase 5 (SCG5) [Leptomonas pyrrhocoris]|uniref:Phosphoglycan beta 13 galactosyltransferase 5 (SCG5) n=1 Tax=Leptomonas pyrrhocoris TaxID=157538 RepID=A0A0M9FRJ6_LEPPY|nr:phosphoglycan beta 13 galactosyltransferase 5 (SCG5) [Leptomonas pyrrhocoris]XP_015653044.1 phosphoglycan beta 13 galactosyltransferase 5 (SCG5) [Leptomonas pyrrhocoris]KPA74604.1 phosphoglycan beta 13 galactosyltransferase 5 (SCG5) [Leptomonas pyrrhocoris]KPA74605.1 phosphoglycan beta 13 galactosyltransferase 5 (SCG5) [Leptomonas pyrrhocoris]|eukprot:XP_015653043.1 phosphoglycan beta 13 galactosyltransferase 5 (SCG5) [Leptomonas pyrrhocoris]
MSHIAHRIITPAVRRAKYSGYVLSSGVRCVIVQDPNAIMPAAAISIHAGQLNDPKELPGLAHFCEHMLFMGTEKFPAEDEFDSFVTKSSGHANAFTADTNTVYYFRVSDGGLEGALERFVEFFAAPSFNPSAVSREVNAVHSEDEMNHHNDYWRLDEVIRGFYSPKHPRSRYGNGNHTTLRDEPQEKGLDVRQALKAFHDRYYLAEGATIVVVSTRSPEEVLRLIEGPLNRMKCGAVPPFSFLGAEEKLFSNAALGSWTNLRTVRKMRELRLMWTVRSPSSKWRSTPSAYVSHLLGHECDTSVLGVLKKRNWATSMVAGPHRVDDDFELLDVSFTLTLSGFQHTLEVVDLLYHGIGQAIAEGVNEEVYTQMKAEERLFFESSDVGAAEDHCATLAENANATDLEHCWIGGDVILEDDLEATLAYARQLTPNNCAVVLQWGEMPGDADTKTEEAGAQEDSSTADSLDEEEDGSVEEGEEDDDEGQDEEDVDGGEFSVEELFASLPAFAQVRATKETRFHKAKYNTVAIPAEQLAQWRAAIDGPYPPELALPAVNPFISTDFTVYPTSGAAPEVEEVTSLHAKTYIRKDTGRHSTFKTALRCNVLSPVAYTSPLNRLYTRVMHGIFSNAITETAYYATLASLGNEVIFSSTGLGLAVEGPSQKLYEFFFAVLRQLLSAEVLHGTPESFATYLEAGLRSIKNVAVAAPYKVAMQVRQKAMHRVNYLFTEMLACAPEANYDGYRAFVQQYLESGLLLECFVAGNVASAEEVRKVFVNPLETLLSELNISVAAKERLPRERDTYGPRRLIGGAEEEVVSRFDVLSMPPFNAADANVVVMADIPVGESTPQVAAVSMAAVKLISSLFFNALRTRETLGYVVFSQLSRTYATEHVVFSVQSALPDVDCIYLLSRIVAFLAAVESQLDVVCAEKDLQTVKAGLIASLEKMPDSVENDALELQSAYLNPCQFERRRLIIAALQTTTVDDVKGFFRRYILNSRTDSRAMVFCINSTRTAAADVLAAPGTRRLNLPAMRANDESTEAPAAAAEEEVTITLPTFEDGRTCVEVTCFASATEYQQGLPIVKSTTY